MGRLALVCVPIALSLFVSELVVLAGSALVYTGGYPDPFAPYEAMMPGQPINSAALAACRFEEMWLVRDMRGYCQLHPEDGPFRLVSIKAQADGVQRLSFRAYGLFYGDVVQRWGLPAVVEPLVSQNEKGIFVALWSSRVYAIIAPVGSDGQLNDLTPVHNLSIEGEQPTFAGSD